VKEEDDEHQMEQEGDLIGEASIISMNSHKERLDSELRTFNSIAYLVAAHYKEL
jgi:hypothetical protein